MACFLHLNNKRFIFATNSKCNSNKRNMEVNELEQLIRGRESALSAVFPALMRKVYTWMAMALFITGICAYGVATSPSILQMLYANSMTIWLLFIAELGLVFYTTARINKLSLTTATTLFIIFSALNGVTLSGIFLVYSMTSIAKVFFITAGTFGAMAVYGYFTKTDLSKIGGILFMALIGLIIATVVNIFMKSAMFDLILCYIGVGIFVGLTAWDSQKIKRMLAVQMDMSEGAQKIALLGALSLYLDFINLFLYMLRIFGGRD
jgi:FtsH-binding integral membrane protein